MPWKAVKKGKTWAVVKKGSGEEIARHQTQLAASAQVRALYAQYNGETENAERFKKAKNATRTRIASAAARRASLGGSAGRSTKPAPSSGGGGGVPPRNGSPTPSTGGGGGVIRPRTPNTKGSYGPRR